MTEEVGEYPEINAALVVAGTDFEPLAFSRATGLAPTTYTRRGEPRPSGRGSYPISTWAQEIVERGDSTDPVVVALLDAIWPARDAIASYLESNPGTAEICCTVTIHERSAALELLPETLSRLAELGLTYGLAIYDYS